MITGGSASLSYTLIEPAVSLVVIRVITTVVRKRERLNNINRLVPEYFPVEGSNGRLSFRM